MSKVFEATSTLTNLENYGPFQNIALNPTFTLYTSSINRGNWDIYYNSILNILKDGIDTSYVQKYMVTIVFADNMTIELSIMDLYLNVIMWRLLVFSDTPIQSYHIFFQDEIKADSIKDYIDKFFIDENRTKYGNRQLSNIIADTIHCFHDIDKFAMYLSNTLNLEDTIELMNADKEFYDCLHLDLAGLPMDEVKSVITQYTDKSIERIKKSKEIIGHDHCLADGWRADEGINPKQYAEVTIGIGIKPDGRGGIFDSIVNASFINKGIVDPVDYFIESSTSRLAQIIKFKNVSMSGTFARILGLNNMDSFLNDNPHYDCHTHNLIPILVKSKNHLKYLNLRYYREQENGIEKRINAFKDKHLIGKTIFLRSPCTCASVSRGLGVCYKCYGDLAYSVFDLQTKMGINIGRIASELVTSKITQGQLSVKHILEAKVEKLEWSPLFSELFEMSENIIQINTQLENLKNYRLLINPDDIEIENEGDEIESLDDESVEVQALAMSEFVTRFEVYNMTTGEVTSICNDKDFKLYITNELNGIIRKKGEPIEGKLTIGFNEIKDAPIFVVSLESNPITQTLDKMKALYNKSMDVHGKRIPNLLQEIFDTNLEANLKIASVHYEIALMNQIRDTDDVLSAPNWDYNHPDYQILTLNESLNSNPSITISMSYQKIMKAFYTPLTYRKKGPSFMDLFFMERPQVMLRGIDSEKPIQRQPGEFYEPVIFSEDPDKVTGDDGLIADLDAEFESDD